MKENKMIKLLVALLFWSFLTTGLAPNAMAVEQKNSITIEWVQTESRPLPGTYSFKLWQVSNSEGDQVHQYDELSALTEEELTARYGQPMESSAIDESGKMILTDLENGIYFAVFPITSDNLRMQPLLLTLPLEGKNDVHLTPKISKDIVGSVELLKVDQCDCPLEKVGFRLFQETTNQEIPINEKGEYDPSARPRELFTDKDGKILVTNLPLGDYYFQETSPLPGYEVKIKNLHFTVAGSETLHLKVVNNQKNTGGYRFQKVGDDKNRTPLAGATFQVMKEVNGKMEPVMQDGKSLFVTSGEDGFFQVAGLPYGTYYIVETRAPKGYELLTEPVKFEVTATSLTTSKSAWIEIVNHAKPVTPGNPPKDHPELPRTGDILFFLLLALGTVLSVMGLLLVRSEDRKTN